MVGIIVVPITIIAIMITLGLQAWRFHFGKHSRYHSTDLLREINYMDHLDGYEFEDYVAKLLRAAHFTNVVQTGKNDDCGLDILASYHHVKYGFQCKHYKKRRVGRKALRITFDGSHYYHTQIPVVITNSYFSREALRCQRYFQVQLWDRSRLIQLIKTMVYHC